MCGSSMSPSKHLRMELGCGLSLPTMGPVSLCTATINVAFGRSSHHGHCNPVLCHLSSQEWVSEQAPSPKLFVLPFTGHSLLTEAMISGLHSC